MPRKPPTREEVVESSLIVNLIVLINKSIAKNRTLFGLAMQPRKHADDMAISDENIYLKWLDSLQKSKDGQKLHQKMLNFTSGLGSFLESSNVAVEDRVDPTPITMAPPTLRDEDEPETLRDDPKVREYKLAMSKLIKASLEEGIFTLGDRNIEPMCNFLKKNPKIADHFSKNINLLNYANGSLEHYIEKNNIKILPKKIVASEEEQKVMREKAAKHLKNARASLVQKIEKEYNELLLEFSGINQKDPKFDQYYNQLIDLHNRIQRLKGVQEKSESDLGKENTSPSPAILPAFKGIKPLPADPRKDTPEKPKPF